MQAVRGGQGYEWGTSKGHLESDADEAAPQWHTLKGTCSYQMKHRPQEQPAHQWQSSASQPHPACPWPEVELGPLWHRQQLQNEVLELWGSAAPGARVALPYKVASRAGKEKQQSPTQNDWRDSKLGSLSQWRVQWALKLQAKSSCVHAYILHLENETTLFIRLSKGSMTHPKS